ncbi:MAG: hypothetical protein ACLQQ4_02435 [Bacteroidia bacterium]
MCIFALNKLKVYPGEKLKVSIKQSKAGFMSENEKHCGPDGKRPGLQNVIRSNSEVNHGCNSGSLKYVISANSNKRVVGK